MKQLSKQQHLHGMELFFITPIILGGSPTAADNRAFLNRVQHIQAVRYWNKIINDLRAQQKMEPGSGKMSSG